MRRAIIALAVLTVPLAARAQPPATGEGYYDRHAEGWFWYHDPAPESEAKPVPAETPPPTPAPAHDPEAEAELKALREKLEHALAAALMAPTEANVRRYLVLDQAARERAGRFASTWQRVVWTTPALDHRLVHPVNDQAVQVFNDEKVQLTDAFLREAARTYGLFFVFRGSCPFCHRLAPVLRTFANTYGFAVVPVSLDGGTLPEFPAPRRNVDLARRLQVDAVPAVFLVDPAKRAIVPVAYGYVGFQELAQRIYTLLNHGPANPMLDANRPGAG